MERGRLLARLDEAAVEHPLILVSAPAGSGKTTLLMSWAAQRQTASSIAWLTCEHEDMGADAFWPLVLEALGRIGVTPPPATSGGSLDPHRRMLGELGATLSVLDRPVTLVLDGFEIDDARLGEDIAFLLRRSRGRLQLILLTRADPVMPLYRFRLEQSITELRMVDLAFTEEETARLVGQGGVVLSAGGVRTLVRRTHGWAAGLRFAVMLLERSDDPDRTVAELAGDSGNIAEYLMAEILQTQPADVRQLLLCTSVVDVLQPGLIEVLGGRAAGRCLSRLAHANVLVEEIVEHPGWFRYHPFLRDLLRAELAYASPRHHRRLHRRAARWYAARGALTEAVTICAAAAAWADAATYAVDGGAVVRLITRDDAGGLVRVLRRMPASAGGAAASVVRAALALADRDPTRCSDELVRARAAAQASGSPVGPAVEVAMDVLEAVQAGSVAGADAVPVAERAVSRLDARTDVRSASHAAFSALLRTNTGIAQVRSGDAAAASATLRTVVDEARRLDLRTLQASAHAHLALVACLEGRLGHGQELASRAIALSDELAQRAGDRPAEAQAALAWVSLERNDTPAAGEQLKGMRRAPNADPFVRALSALLRSRLLRAQGEADKAIQLADEASHTLPSHVWWLTDLLRLEVARASIERGSPELALPVIDNLQGPHLPGATVVLGRAHVALGKWDAVGHAVTALVGGDSTTPVPAAVAGRLLESAHALHRGDQRLAKAALDRALRLAAPECLRSPFREAPTAVRAMLKADNELLQQHAWLGAGAVPRTAGGQQRTLLRTHATTAPARDEPVESLTPKEQEVLGYLAELLSTQEIADTMFVSVNTVRTHVRSILRKLAVTRRNEAVRRARSLSLLSA